MMQASSGAVSAATASTSRSRICSVRIASFDILDSSSRERDGCCVGWIRIEGNRHRKVRLACRAKSPRLGFHRDVKPLLGADSLLDGKNETLRGGDHHTGCDRMKVCAWLPFEHLRTRHSVMPEVPSVIDDLLSGAGVDEPIDEAVLVEWNGVLFDRDRDGSCRLRHGQTFLLRSKARLRPGWNFTDLLTAPGPISSYPSGSDRAQRFSQEVLSACHLICTLGSARRVGFSREVMGVAGACARPVRS